MQPFRRIRRAITSSVQSIGLALWSHQYSSPNLQRRIKYHYIEVSLGVGTEYIALSVSSIDTGIFRLRCVSSERAPFLIAALAGLNRGEGRMRRYLVKNTSAELIYTFQEFVANVLLTAPERVLENIARSARTKNRITASVALCRIAQASRYHPPYV